MSSLATKCVAFWSATLMVAVIGCSSGCRHASPSQDAPGDPSLTAATREKGVTDQTVAQLTARVAALESEISQLRAELQARPGESTQPATLPADPTTLPTRLPSP